VKADVSAFSDAVTDARVRLKRLNDDGSLDGVVARFNRLTNDLPPDFFRCEFVPTIGAKSLEKTPPFVVRISPGPRLHAFAIALRALDLSVDVHAGSFGSAKDVLLSA
jgi:hypothetical protein